MYKYLISIYHYFEGYQQFCIEAKSDDDAISKAKDEAQIYGIGKYDTNDVRIISKTPIN